MLEQNMQSVRAQTCGDWEHVIIHDAERRGMRWADKALDKYRQAVRGDYVYILDDDCWLLEHGFVADVKALTRAMGGPDIVMVKSRRPPGPPSDATVFPTKDVWDLFPKHGHTNCLCYVVKAALWKKHIVEFGRKPWGGDFWFLDKIWPLARGRLWLDLIVAEAQQLGRGKKFESFEAGWFDRLAFEYKFLYEKRHDVWRATGQ